MLFRSGRTGPGLTEHLYALRAAERAPNQALFENQDEDQDSDEPDDEGAFMKISTLPVSTVLAILGLQAYPLFSAWILKWAAAATLVPATSFQANAFPSLLIPLLYLMVCFSVAEMIEGVLAMQWRLWTFATTKAADVVGAVMADLPAQDKPGSHT